MIIHTSVIIFLMQAGPSSKTNASMHHVKLQMVFTSGDISWTCVNDEVLYNKSAQSFTAPLNIIRVRPSTLCKANGNVFTVTVKSAVDWKAFEAVIGWTTEDGEQFVEVFSRNQCAFIKH